MDPDPKSPAAALLASAAQGVSRGDFDFSSDFKDRVVIPADAVLEAALSARHARARLNWLISTHNRKTSIAKTVMVSLAKDAEPDRVIGTDSHALAALFATLSVLDVVFHPFDTIHSWREVAPGSEPLLAAEWRVFSPDVVIALAASISTIEADAMCDVISVLVERNPESWDPFTDTLIFGLMGLRDERLMVERIHSCAYPGFTGPGSSMPVGSLVRLMKRRQAITGDIRSMLPARRAVSEWRERILSAEKSRRISQREDAGTPHGFLADEDLLGYASHASVMLAAAYAAMDAENADDAPDIPD